MQPSYTHTGETKTENTQIRAYLQIMREDSAPEQIYLCYLLYNSTKWLDELMCSELHVFIRQSLPPKVYNLAYETHIKKSQRTEREAKRQRDIWWGLSGFVGAPSPCFFLVWVFNKDPLRVTEVTSDATKWTSTPVCSWAPEQNGLSRYS